MTEIPAEVYEAAARARAEHQGTVIDMPVRKYAWRCPCGAERAPTDPVRTWERAATELNDHMEQVVVDAVYPLIHSAGVAAGRAQAAADIRARAHQDGLHGAEVYGYFQAHAEFFAKLAEGGDPR